MSTDPSSDVANPRDVRAAQASTNVLKAFITKSRGEMRRVTSNLSAETGLGSLKRRALDPIRSEKIQEISARARRPPIRTSDHTSFDPYPHAGSAVTQTGGDGR